MQGAGIALIVQAIVIVDAVGDVAGLLGFQNQRAGLDGVHAAGIDLEEVALVDGDLVEQVAPAALVNQLCELIAGRGVLSHNDGGVRIAI